MSYGTNELIDGSKISSFFGYEPKKVGDVFGLMHFHSVKFFVVTETFIAKPRPFTKVGGGTGFTNVYPFHAVAK
jgi:hypothetical protein